jgi:hypothetical protein
MEVKNPRNPDLRSVIGKVLLPLAGSEEESLPFFKEIGKGGSFCPLDDVILLASASIEEGFLSFDAHLPNKAEIGTPLHSKEDCS